MTYTSLCGVWAYCYPDGFFFQVSLDGARGILINIAGGADLTMEEVEEAASWVQVVQLPCTISKNNLDTVFRRELMKMPILCGVRHKMTR